MVYQVQLCAKPRKTLSKPPSWAFLGLASPREPSPSGFPDGLPTAFQGPLSALRLEDPPLFQD